MRWPVNIDRNGCFQGVRWATGTAFGPKRSDLSNPRNEANLGSAFGLESFHDPPDPDGTCGTGKDAEVSGVTEIEYDIDQCYDARDGDILEKPSLNEVVSKFAGEARRATEDDAKANEATERSEPTVGFDGVEQITEQDESQADDGNKDAWS